MRIKPNPLPENVVEPSPQLKSASGSVSMREIWVLTWPQALMMFFQFIIGMTDVVVAGEVHHNVQAALGLINRCQFLFLVFGVALVNGGVAAMSQSLGAKLPRRAERYMGLLFKLIAAVCLAAMVLGFLFRYQILWLLQVPEEIFQLSVDLWTLMLFVLPFSYLTISTAGIFRAKKMVRIPLVSAIVVCAVNIVGDLGLGLGWFGMPALGGEGLIYSTIASVAAGAVYNLFCLARIGLVSRRILAPRKWEKRAVPYLLKVAIPSGGTTLLWQLGYLVLFVITNTLPENRVASVAGLTAGLSVEAILFLPAFAFSMTGSILIGHCLGAGNKEEAKRVGLRIIGSGVLCMSVLGLVMLPFVWKIMAFVAPEPVVQTIAVSYLLYNIAAVPFTVTSMIMSGIFSGAGASIYSFLAFTIATWFVRLPLAWFVGHIVWGNASGVFLAMLISQIVQASFSFYLFLRRDWYRFAGTVRRREQET